MANWLSGYTTRKKISIDYTKIDATLTDFPVLVKLTSSNFDFSKANSDGYDIRFTSADGTTLLKYERERHDATNKLAEYWVKIPSVSSSADTSFYIYYRTTDTADGADPTNVWDSSFKMVQHMNDKTTSTIEDSTSNNNDGTKKAANEPIQADGQIAKAQDFDGTDDYIQLPNLNMQPITISLLIKADSLASTRNPFALCGGRIQIGTSNNNTISLAYYTGSWNQIDASVSTGTWYHIVGVVPSSGGTARLYVNGAEEGNKSVGTVSFMSCYTGLGAVYNGTSYINFFNGLIDEIRVSNVARSAAWIKADYNSVNNSLVSYGAEEGMDNAIFFGINL